MPRKTDYHTMRINIPYNLYCQLKIRSFESGLGLYEFAKPEIEAFKQGLINLCTPPQVLQSNLSQEESQVLKERLESQPTDSALAAEQPIPVEQQVTEQVV